MSFKLFGQKYRINLRLAILANISREGARPDERFVGAGLSVCNPLDFFNPAKGARLAIQRALQAMRLTKCERGRVWEQINGKIDKKSQEVFDEAVVDVGDELRNELGF